MQPTRIILTLLVILTLSAAALVAALQPAQQRQTEQAIDTAVADAASRFERTPPLLLGPDDEQPFSNIAEVVLTWHWQRPLRENEVFDVRVWREGEPANGITWTDDTAINLTWWLLYQAPGPYQWTVSVIELDEDGQALRDVTELAAPRRFTLVDDCLCILEVPPGFQYDVYAELPFSLPTVITFGPDERLYALSVEGTLARMDDKDGDAIAETATILFDDPDDQLTWAVGLDFHEGEAFISHSGQISRYSDSDGDQQWDTLQPIIEGLPTLQHVFHSNNGIAFGPDGKLYVGVGSTTDHGPLRVPYEAAILRLNPDGSDLEVFATGFRNPYDLTFSPTGDLFTADNSPDELDDRLYFLPPEELNWVQQGRDYGFPDTFGRLNLEPDSEPPVAELFTSSASSGLVYYAAAAFPERYRNGIFLAQFGTGAAVPIDRGIRTGQQVVFIPLNPEPTGGYSGVFEPFIRFRSELGDYAPIDVTVGPDGALYVAEWTLGVVFRVSYVGEAAHATADLSLDMGESLFTVGKTGVPGCVTCHLAAGGGVGPPLSGLSDSPPTRLNNLPLADYIRQSIIAPSAFITPGYQDGLMYPGYAGQLTPEELEALVDYVLMLNGMG